MRVLLTGFAAAMAFCVVTYENAEAQTTEGTETASSVTLEDAEAACRDRPAFSEAYPDDPDANVAFAYLAEGAKTLQNCTRAVQENVRRLGGGEVSFEQDWDPFNQQLQMIIDQFNREISAITNPGGVLETAKVLQTHIDSEIEATQDIYANDEAKMNKVIEGLERDKVRLQEGIVEMETYTKEIRLRLTNLYKERPKYAAQMRRRAISDAIDDIETIVMVLGESEKVLRALEEHEGTEGTGQ